MANSVLTNLNRARYSGLDFDSYNDELRAYLQVQFAADFNDFAVSSLGIMLMDLTSYGLDTLSFYLDRRATDTYLATARTRKSVSRLARQLGYATGGAVSSSLDLTVSITTPVAFSVPIPKGFKFQGPNNTVFETAYAVTFPPSSGPTDTIDIPCYEGETFTENFVSDGTANQVFKLRRVPDGKQIVQGAVEVTVNAASWTYVPLLEYGATDQFEIGFGDDPPTVRFGDSLAGNIPATGATIQVTYVASRGMEGQVATGTITAPVTPLVVMFQTIPLTVVNKEPSVGGDGIESIARVKTYAPKVFKTRGVAVTLDDYSSLSGSYSDPLFGRVAIARAISSRSASTDIELQNLLAAIDAAIALFAPIVTAQTAAITAAVTSASASAVAISTNFSDIATYATTLDTSLATQQTNVRSIKNTAGEVAVDAADIQSYVVSGTNAINAITTAGSDQLTAGTKTALIAWLNLINAEAVGIAASASGTIQPTCDTVLAALASGRTTLASIGLDLVTPGSELYDSNSLLTALTAQLAAVTAANVAIINAQTNVVSTVNATTADILAHVDAILSDDCKANVVSVPILTKDAAGFYAAPSSGLVASLQTYLDARKEVTQSVVVTSGASFLVPAVISVRVGVNRAYSEAVVKAAVDAAIDGVLRDRTFGSSLYESDLEDAVLAVTGVTFTNVTIDGYSTGAGTSTSKNDSSGNLIIDATEVVTKGTTTISTEVAP